jgi:hypothetical protein
MRTTVFFGTLATILLFLCTAFAYAEVQVGVKAGDWIKYDATTSSVDLASTNMPQWVKIEFLGVTETTVTFRQTQHMSGGAEQSEIMMLDVASGTGNATFQIIIPANSKTGDTIKIVTDEGNYTVITLSGEETGNYAGATRTVVYASLQQGDTQLSYYWDKQTGVLLKIKLSQGSEFIAYKATSTNMWQASSNPLTLPTIPIEMLSISISIAAATAIITTALIHTKRKRS